MNQSFCSLQWAGLSVDPDGSVKPCCVSHDYIKKDDGTNYNLGRDNLTDIYNSPDFLKMRSAMLAGDPIPGCAVCYSNEKSSSNSKRIESNSHWSISNPTIVIENPKIKYIDLRFGNLCNLSCRSCNPRNSSQIEKELKTAPAVMHNFVMPGYSFDVNTWYHSDTFKKNMETQLNNIEYLYITGGEPTLIDQNIQYMEKLIELGRNDKIVLSISTNMTTTKPRFYELISKFRITIIGASIDGYQDMQEYLRYPSNWEQIDTNLKKLIAAGSNVRIQPAPVIQITNLSRITELFEYFEKFNREAGKKIVDMFPIILHDPKYLNVEYLPLEYKTRCWEIIEEWIATKCKYQSDFFLQRMEGLKYKCHVDIDYTEKLREYAQYNLMLDNMRGQQLEKVNPILYKLLQTI